VTLLALVVAASPASAAVTATVSPNADLADGQAITVTADGFQPNIPIGTAECGSGASGTANISECDLSTSVLGQSDAQGHGSLTLRVKRTILTGSGKTIDCATTTDPCVVGVANLSNYSQSAGGPITFDPDAPPVAAPVVTVTPDSDLLDKQLVHVNVTGFIKNEWVTVTECPADSTNNCYPVGPSVGFSGQANANGVVDADLAVRRILSDNGERLDCADGPGTCTIVARSQGLQPGIAQLAFDASVQPPPPPTLTVTPDSGLADRQIVRITGSGFTPLTQVAVQECLAGGDAGSGCSNSASRYVDVDDTGALTTSLMVRRIVNTYVPVPVDGSPPPGPVQVDCATADNPCVIQVTNYADPTESTSAAITFDPNAPAPPAQTMSATPTTDLRDGDSIAVTADNYPPGASLYVVECLANAVDANGCDTGHLGGAMADDDGHATATFTAMRQLHAGGSTNPVDCASAPGACKLVVAFLGDTIEASNTPLSFDPNGPIGDGGGGGNGGGGGGDPKSTTTPSTPTDPAVDATATTDPTDDTTTTDASTELARTGADSTNLTAIAFGFVLAGLVIVQVSAVPRRSVRRREEA
jgi:hypothetical protein